MIFGQFLEHETDGFFFQINISARVIRGGSEKRHYTFSSTFWCTFSHLPAKKNKTKQKNNASEKMQNHPADKLKSLNFLLRKRIWRFG